MSYIQKRLYLAPRLREICNLEAKYRRLEMMLRMVYSPHNQSPYRISSKLAHVIHPETSHSCPRCDQPVLYYGGPYGDSFPGCNFQYCSDNNRIWTKWWKLKKCNIPGIHVHQKCVCGFAWVCENYHQPMCPCNVNRHRWKRRSKSIT